MWADIWRPYLCCSATFVRSPDFCLSTCCAASKTHSFVGSGRLSDYFRIEGELLEIIKANVPAPKNRCLFKKTNKLGITSEANTQICCHSFTNRLWWPPLLRLFILASVVCFAGSPQKSALDFEEVFWRGLTWHLQQRFRLWRDTIQKKTTGYVADLCLLWKS